MFVVLELNEYLLKEETSSIIDEHLVLNTIALANQVEHEFVLFVHNPDGQTTSIWKDFFVELSHTSENKGNRGERDTLIPFSRAIDRLFLAEVQLYEEYRQNSTSASSSDPPLLSSEDRAQVYSRVSSSKSLATELTERSSLAGSVTRARATPLVHLQSLVGHRCRSAPRLFTSESIENLLSSQLQGNKDFCWLPDFPSEEFQRPVNNIFHLSARHADDLDNALRTAMFFGRRWGESFDDGRSLLVGVVVLLDECPYLRVNGFLHRLVSWSAREDPCRITFPRFFRLEDEKIFVNSSFRLILNFDRIDGVGECCSNTDAKGRSTTFTRFRLDGTFPGQSLRRSEFQFEAD